MDAASLIKPFLRDFSPDDGYRQSNLLEGADLRATLKALARFHAHFSEAARRPRPDEKWRCGGHWQPAYQNAEQFESAVEDAWPRLLENFRGVFEASPATRDLDLEALGGRVQRAAVAAGAAAHPFAAEDVSADVEEWRTLIHGDLKAANVLVKGRRGGSVGFPVRRRWARGDGPRPFPDGVGGRLRTPRVTTGRCGMGNSWTSTSRNSPRCATSTATHLNTSSRSPLWTRRGSSSRTSAAHRRVAGGVERGADIWNRNSYNKDIKAATWLVARTAHALDIS